MKRALAASRPHAERRRLSGRILDVSRVVGRDRAAEEMNEKKRFEILRSVPAD